MEKLFRQTSEKYRALEAIGRIMWHVQYSWQWVRGHNDNPGNKRADELANMGTNQLRSRLCLLEK